VSLLSQRFVLPSGLKLTSALEVALSSIAKSLAPVLPAWPRQPLGEQENGTTKLEEAYYERQLPQGARYRRAAAQAVRSVKRPKWGRWILFSSALCITRLIAERC
jgi:hypothetical protein